MLLIFYCTYLLEVSRNRVREDVALDFKEEGICFLFSYKSVFHGLSSLGTHSSVTDEH